VEGEEILATAFLPRENETYLSVNWVEFLAQATRRSELGELRMLYKRKFSVGAGAKIAILNVGRMRAWVRGNSPDQRNLEARHEPLLEGNAQDPSHSGIFNIRYDDELIAELIVQAISESHPARQWADRT
jgi:hypothetical protein